MALINDSRLFTGGAVKLDSTPYMNFQTQLMAKKAARDEALDEYYRNLTKGINPQGLRTQDVNGFMKRTNDLQSYYQQNRDSIKNPRLDNGAAQTRYGQMYQDALMYVNSSKNEEEKKKPLVAIMSDPDKRDRIPDAVFTQLHAHDLPLDHPDRQSFDISHLEYEPKPFDLPKYLKGFEHIARHDNVTVGATDPKSLMRTITTKSIYDDSAKQQIYGIAASDYMHDHSFKAAVDSAMKDKGTYDRLNEVFKSNYGHNIENDKDFATAYTIEKLQPEIRKEAVKDDVFARQKAFEAIRHANAKDLIRYRHDLTQGDKELDDLWIKDYIDKATVEARSGGQKRTYSSANGEKFNGRKIEVDPLMAKALGFNEKNRGELIVTDDGKYVPVFYETDANYAPIVKKGAYQVASDRTTKLTKEQLMLVLGSKTGVKQLNKEMSATGQPVTKQPQQSNSYLIKGKKYSESDLIKMGYTPEQIAPYKQ